MSDEAPQLSALQRLRKLRDDDRYERMPKSEQRAFDNTLLEAEKVGASLKKEGFGGLPSSLALGVFRRDQFRCKRCGTRDGIGLHHKGGIRSSRHAHRGKRNDLTNVVTLCKPCHNSVHDDDRGSEG